MTSRKEMTSRWLLQRLDEDIKEWQGLLPCPRPCVNCPGSTLVTWRGHGGPGGRANEASYPSISCCVSCLDDLEGCVMTMFAYQWTNLNQQAKSLFLPFAVVSQHCSTTTWWENIDAVSMLHYDLMAIRIPGQYGVRILGLQRAYHAELAHISPFAVCISVLCHALSCIVIIYKYQISLLCHFYITIISL